MNYKVNLTGRVFGRLTVLSQIGKNQWGQSTWLCKCECGKTTEAVYQRLTQDQKKSCGCLRKRAKTKP